MFNKDDVYALGTKVDRDATLKVEVIIVGGGRYKATEVLAFDSVQEARRVEDDILENLNFEDYGIEFEKVR